MRTTTRGGGNLSCLHIITDARSSCMLRSATGPIALRCMGFSRVCVCRALNVHPPPCAGSITRGGVACIRMLCSIFFLYRLHVTRLLLGRNHNVLETTVTCFFNIDRTAHEKLLGGAPSNKQSFPARFLRLVCRLAVVVHELAGADAPAYLYVCCCTTRRQ